MATKTYICDKCGKELDGDKAYYDVGSEQDFCELHYYTHLRAQLLLDINKKKEWLEQTHLADIKKWTAEAERLAKGISRLEAGG